MKKETDNGFVAFLTLASAIDSQTVPPADAEDAIRGAKHIPAHVTELRRAGKRVEYDPVKSEWDYEGEIIK